MVDLAQNMTRSLTIEGRDVGLDQLASQVDRVTAAQTRAAGAGDVLSSSQERVGRSTLSVTRQLDAFTRAHDPLARAQAQVERGERLIETARRQGTVVSESAMTALANARKRYEELTQAMNDNATAAERASAAAPVDETERLRSKYVPGYASDLERRDKTREVERAEAIGALSTEEAVAALDRLDSGTVAYGANLDRLTAKYAPLRAAEQQRLETIDEIEAAERAGAITLDEAVAAIDRATQADKERLRARYVPGANAAFERRDKTREIEHGEAIGAITTEEAIAALDRLDKGANSYGSDLERLVAKYAPLRAAEQQRLATIQEIEAAERAGAITIEEAIGAYDRLDAAAARSLDGIRAKYLPLFQIEQQHKAALDEIGDALDKGALNSSEASAAVDRLTASYQKQRAAAVAQVQAPLNALLGVRDDFGADRRSTDIAAYGAELDRLETKYAPLVAAERSHLLALAEIDDAERKGAIGHNEATKAIDLETAAYKRQRAELLSTSRAPMIERLTAWTQQSNSFSGRLDAWSGGQRQRAQDTANAEAGSAEKERARDEARAKWSPIFREQQQYLSNLREIRTELKAGNLDQAEAAAAIERTKKAFAQSVVEMRGAAGGKSAPGTAGAGLQRHEIINLAQQGSDVMVSLAGGQNPALVALQQGSQIGAVLGAHKGGAAAAVGELGGMITRVALNPITLLTSGLVGLTYAAYRYTDQQEQLNRALNGIGRASGASPEQLRSTAAAASRSGALSQGQAVTAAAQYASVGIGVENLPTLLADTRRYSHAFGVDMDAAQQEIAQIVSEDGLGAFEKRFGSVSAATREWLTDLERSGRFAEAAAFKTGLLHEQTQKAADAAGPLTKAWEWLSSIPGDAANGAALLTRVVVDGLTPRSRTVELPKPAPAPIGPASGESILDYERRIGLTPEVTPAQRERRLSELNRGSKLAADIVDRYAPEEEQRRGVRRDLDALKPFTESAEAMSLLGDRAGLVKQAVADLAKALEMFETPAEKMRRDSELAGQSIEAYGFEQRKAVAEEQAYRQTIAATQKESLAAIAKESAGNLALAQSRRQLADMAREEEDRAQLRGLTPLQAALKEIETRFARLREQLGPDAAPGLASLQQQSRLDLLSQTSFQALDAARPDLAERRQIAETRAALAEFLSDPDGLAALGDRADEARQAIGNLNNRLAVWRSTVQTIALDASLAAKAMEAYTFGQKELAAQQQAWLAVMRQTGDAAQAAAAAEKARIELIAQGNRAADDMLRSAKDQAELIGLDPIQADLKRNEQNYRRFVEQNAPGPDRTEEATRRFAEQYLSAAPQEQRIETALLPMRKGFDAAGAAAEKLAGALSEAADKIGGSGVANAPTAASGTLPAFAGTGSAFDPRGVAGYIRERATAYGLNPGAVLGIAKSEGLSQFYGDKGTSFGALQLHVGGGLGDTFRRQTGLDPSDPHNERMTIDWGLRYMRDTRDVSPWHGAARVGITNADVFGGGAPATQSRADPEARQALGLQNNATLWSHVGSQLQSLDKEMQSHVRLIQAQEGALTADDATLEGVVSAQQLANRLVAEGADIERDSVLVKRDGVLTTVRLKDAILDHGRAATEAARAEEEFQRARRRYIAELDLARSAVSDTGSSALKALVHGENVGDAARNALASAGDRAIDFGVSQFSEFLLGPQGTANTGWLGDILGIGGKDKNTANMNVKASVVNVAGGAGGVPGLGGGSGLLDGLFGANDNFAGQAAGAVGPFQQTSIFDSIGGFLSGLFSFAEGGVMTSSGALPLKRYSAGGVADRPQIVLFGEGRHPEAYIPMTDRRGLHVVVDRQGKAQVALPDGRGIPAVIEGSDDERTRRAQLDMPGGRSLNSDIKLSRFAEGGVMTSSGALPLLRYAAAASSAQSPKTGANPSTNPTAAAAPVVVNFHLPAGANAQSFQQSEGQITAMMARALTNARRFV